MKLPGAAFRQTQHFPGISGCCETWVPRAHYAPWRVPTNGCSNRGSGELKWDASKVTMLNKALDSIIITLLSLVHTQDEFQS